MKPKLLALLVASPSLTALAARNSPRPRSVDGDAVAPRRRRRLATTCEFCPRGLAASPRTPVPSSGGETCGSLHEAAPTLDGDEYFCTDVVVPAEGLCCGDDSAGKGSGDGDGATDDDPDTDDDLRNPCPVCEGGVTEGLDKIIGRSPDGELRTCGTLMVDALKVEEGSVECDAMMGAEVRCCPPGDDEDDDEEDDEADDEEDGKVEESGGGCPVCANGQGLTVKGDTPIPYPEANGASCEDMLEFAKDVDADGDDCAQMMRAESVCCPRPPEDSVGRVDDDAAEDAADDPCPVCEGGITVPGETVIGEAGGVTFTCGGLMVDALKEEEGGRVCGQMMTAEGLCCPPEDEDEDDDKEEDDDEKVKDPCPVCSGGITVPGDTVIGRQGGVPLTCGGLIVDALEEEEGGEVCDAMMTAEGLCCPPKEDDDEDGEDDDWEDDDDEKAENPCPVCPGGITVPGDTIIGKQGDVTFTCGGMVVDALEEEEDGEVCEAMMTAEGLCCPPDDDDDDEDPPKPAEPEDVPAPTEAPEDVPAPTESPKDAPATTKPGYGGYPATPPADDAAAPGTAPPDDAETPATSPPDTPAPGAPNEKGAPTPAPTTHTPSYNPTAGPPPTTNAPFKAFVDPDSRPPPATEAAPPAPSNDTAVVVGPSNSGYLELNDMPTESPKEGSTSTAPTASPVGAALENLPASGPTYEGPPDISASSVVPSFASLAFAAFSILYCGAFLA